jgi:hypothetical protein
MNAPEYELSERVVKLLLKLAEPIDMQPPYMKKMVRVSSIAVDSSTSTIKCIGVRLRKNGEPEERGHTDFSLWRDAPPELEALRSEALAAHS